MTKRIRRLCIVAGRKAVLWGVVCGAFVPTARGQNFVYGQTGLGTGQGPSAVAIADLNGDGRLDLVVSNQADNTVSVILSKSDGTFALRRDYPVGNTPMGVATGDFNGDGIVDLAIVNSQDNTVSVLLGIGNGNFAPQVTYPTGVMPIAIASADFNEDKLTDLAIANQGDSTISILLANPDGTFSAQSPLSQSGPVFSLKTADFNGDGKPDLVALSGTQDSNVNLVVYLSAGNGTFSSGSAIASAGFNSMALGDFNGDGIPDVAVTIPSISEVLIFLGNGQGGFSSQTLTVNSILGPPPTSLAAGDFNQDGKTDLAVYNYYNVAIFISKGDGSFQAGPLQGIPITTNPPVMESTDLNNDGLADLVSLDPDDNMVILQLGNGDGTLGTRKDVTLPASGGIGGVTAGDFNRNGKMDLAVAQFNQPQTGPIQGFLTTLLGNGDGTFQSPFSGPMSDIGIAGAVEGDFNGDGNPDVATAWVDADGGLAIFLGNGMGAFGAPIVSYMGASGLNLIPMVAGDLNGDGKTDLVVVSESDQTTNTSPVYVLISNGDGIFQENLLYGLSSETVPYLALEDINGDSRLDLVVGTSLGVYVFLGNGDGTFSRPTIYSTKCLFTNSVALGDFNGDGKVDIVVGCPDVLLFYAGNGNGTFRAPVSTPTLTNAIMLTAGDFNGDGKLDVISGGLVLLGNGDGTFRAGIPFEGTFYSRLYGTGDINSDGVPDLFNLTTGDTTSVSAQTITVWASRPSPSFTSAGLQFGTQAVSTASAPQAVSLANAGNSPLVVSSVKVSGDYSENDNCATTLKVGEVCTMSVTFTPQASGLRTGNLTIVDNAMSASQTLPLAGWAGAPGFSMSVTPAMSSITAGSSAKFQLTLTAGGGFSGIVQVACSGAPTEATCAASPSSPTVGGIGPTRVNVTVTTTAPTQSTTLPGTPFLSPVSTGTIAVFFFLLMFCVSLRSKKSNLSADRIALFACAIFSLIALANCGGGGSSGGNPAGQSGTPAGTYTLTLAATGNGASQSIPITLTVQ